MADMIEGHGGDLALATLRAYGVTEMFTLSGGHVFPLYDAAGSTGANAWYRVYGYAAFRLTAPLASGLLAVRATLASRSRSTMSL